MSRISVNFDLPNVPEDYVHRTGRAGSRGQAVSLVSADEIKQLKDIERLIKKPIPREEIDGFEPGHSLPVSGAGKPRSEQDRSGAGRNRGPHGSGQDRGIQAPRGDAQRPSRRRRRPARRESA